MAASSAETADSMTGQADSMTGQADGMTWLADSGLDSPAPGPDSLAAEPSGKPQGMLAYLRQSRAIQVIMVVAQCSPAWRPAR